MYVYNAVFFLFAQDGRVASMEECAPCNSHEYLGGILGMCVFVCVFCVWVLEVNFRRERSCTQRIARCKKKHMPTLYTDTDEFQSACFPAMPTAMSTLVVESSEACAERLSHDLVRVFGSTGALANRLDITIFPCVSSTESWNET